VSNALCFFNLHWGCSSTEFHNDLYICHISPDDVLSVPKHVVSEIIKTSVSLTVISPFLFVSNINTLQQYKTVNIHAVTGNK
jgi:hypothetical protein